MKKILGIEKILGFKKILGFLAVAGLFAVTAPAQKANAMSLSSPGIAGSVQGNANEALTTQVQYRHGYRGHHGYHGMRRHGWNRPHFVHRRHGWGRPHHWHRRHWR